MNPNTPAYLGDVGRRAPASVLVVDDDPQIRQAIRWALEDEGYLVRVAADGGEALERAAENVPDMVVLDITLPVRDGYEVARELRTRYGAALRILAITADGQAPQKAQRAGANAFLRKPFELNALLAAVGKGTEGIAP